MNEHFEYWAKDAEGAKENHEKPSRFPSAASA